MSIEDRVKGFIASEKPAALVISGKWGQGKTHFWKAAARRYALGAKKYRPNYAYVSLFGVTSLADLRATLAQKIRPVEQLEDDTFAALLSVHPRRKNGWVVRFFRACWTFIRGLSNKEWRAQNGQRLRSASKQIARTASDAGFNIPYLGNLGPFYLAYAYNDVRRALICIDDIERRGSNLSLLDVMGLISDLVTERLCSVVVVLNDGALNEDDESVWLANKEKVFSGELTFRGSPEACASYVYGDPPYDRIDSYAIDAIAELDIVNVRVIERIRSTIQMVFGALSGEINVETKRCIVRGVVLLVYCHTCAGDGAPPLSRVRGSVSAQALLRLSGGKTDERSEQEKKWDVVLRNYAYNYGDSLDTALDEVVTHGFPDVRELQLAVDAWDARASAAHREAELMNAWRLFHDHYADNGGDIVQAISKAFFNLSGQIDPTNTDAAVRLMRKLGASDVAWLMIKTWIDERLGDRWKELESGTIDTFGKIKDVDFEAAIISAQAVIADKHRRTFDDVMKTFHRDSWLAGEALETLYITPVDEYVRFFRENGSVDISRLLSTEQQTTDVKVKAVRDRTREALEILAAENPTNAARIEWFYGRYLESGHAD